ncbi:MAG: hypothetical protein A2X08_13505 [Bacteroidetes bacterium GWA2_32_17]|nr:MAG: hypothetical protein A2X08_13505 [Bacteroidetes bacterium GWA2_32_17]
MATFKRIEEIEAWVLARNICKEIYAFTKQNDFSKDFDLVKQIRRSSGSVMDNIAEGFEREGKLEFIHFLSISKGSNSEVKSQLYRAFDQNYITQKQLDLLHFLCDKESKILSGLMKYLNSSDIKGIKFKKHHEPETKNHKPETKNHKPETKNQ